MVLSIHINKLYLLFIVLIYSTLLNGNSDSLENRIGISFEKSSILKIIFKHKPLFTKNIENDTLDVLVNYNNVGKIDLLKVYFHRSNITYYQIQNNQYVFQNNNLFTSDRAKDIIKDSRIYEYLYLSKGRNIVFNTDLPSTLDVSIIKRKYGKKIVVSKRDVTNLDTFTCKIISEIHQGKNNNILSFDTKTFIFNDYSQDYFKTIKSIYFYDSINPISKEIYFLFKKDSIKSVIYDKKEIGIKVDSGINKTYTLFNFPLKSLSYKNKFMNLTDLVKKEYLLVKFTYNSCGPCIMTIPLFEEINRRDFSNLEIININVLDEKKDIVRFNKKNKVNVETYYNPEIKSVINHLISSYPTFLIINKKLEVLFEYNGYSPELDKILINQIKLLP